MAYHSEAAANETRAESRTDWEHEIAKKSYELEERRYSIEEKQLALSQRGFHLGLVGLLVVFFTLLVQVLQTSDLIQQANTLEAQAETSQKLAKATIHQNLMQQCNMLSQNIRNAPQVAPYLYDGKTFEPTGNVEADTELRALIDVACEDKLDVMDTVLDMKSSLEGIFPNDPGWEAWIVDSFKTSPMLCDKFENSRWWLEAKPDTDGKHTINSEMEALMQRGINARMKDAKLSGNGVSNSPAQTIPLSQDEPQTTKSTEEISGGISGGN